jgi:isochorismate synthase
MQDSFTKIQQPELRTPENGWAFFTKPNEKQWYHIKGLVKTMADAEKKECSAPASSEKFTESGFYYNSFPLDSNLRYIAGSAKVVVAEQLTELLNSCLDEFSILPKQTLSDSTLRLDFDREILGIQDQIKLGNYVKMVAARKQTWGIERWDNSQLASILIDLKVSYPQTFVFVLYTYDTGLWIGATPEQLLTLKQSRANVMALAGTLTTDQRNWTSKEQEEQQVTHDFIGETIKALGLTASTMETSIREINLTRVKHLLREWKFILKYEDVFPLVKALHPTPAVGGFPQEESVKWLQNNENFDRRLYTGWMGYADPENETIDFYVALRCGELYSNALTCYAGCGINLGSDLEVEWMETEYKLSMLAEIVLKHIKAQ